MQQRVGIARALTSNAGIMLMAEAFPALDPLIRTDMQNLLLELQAELHKTIVFITHALVEALKLADHLVILKDGQAIQQGEPQGILLNPADPLYRGLHRRHQPRPRAARAVGDDAGERGCAVGAGRCARHARKRDRPVAGRNGPAVPGNA